MRMLIPVGLIWMLAALGGCSVPVRPDPKMLAAWTTELAFRMINDAYASRKISAAISRSRDGFLLAAIAERLNAGESVLAVFGASHLMIQRPVLDAMLGKPCYVGSELTLAATSGC